MNNRYIRTCQLANHICLFPLLYIYFDVQLLILSFIYSLFLILIISVGFHRLFAHRSFKTYLPIELIFLFLGTVTTLGSSISWIGAHLYHHAHSDREDDIHSPVNGRLKAWFGFWPTFFIRLAHVKHIVRQNEHKFFHRNYFVILFSYIGFLLVAFGLQGVVYFYCFPAVYCFHITSAVNVLGHGNKDKNEKTGDLSKNVLWLSLLSSGEGYHLNHHVSPRKIRFGKWDLGYFFVKLIQV